MQDITICKDSTTTMQAGSGFTSYLWSNGSTTQDSGELPVGSYYVDLGFDGCTYRQNVTVFAAPEITIQTVEVKGSSVQVFVTGGEAPYQYSLDGINWQDSNQFSDVNIGINKVFVKDKFNCDPVSREFLVVNLLNVITPNRDGYNDVLNYSDLRIKKNVYMRIFDRFGKSVFEATSDRFIWDGTNSGRPVPSATYWYILKWTEPDTDLAVEYHGWVLVKNR